MEAKSKITAFLDIRGFSGDPSIITTTLGIEPNEVWLKDDIISDDPFGDSVVFRGKRPRRRKYSVWKIKASSTDSDNVQDYINEIMETIYPARENFIKLPENVNIEMCIWLDIHKNSSVPCVSIKSESMGFLSSIGADIDIDISLID